MRFFRSLFSLFIQKFPKNFDAQARLWHRIALTSFGICLLFVILGFEKDYLWFIPSLIFLGLSLIARREAQKHPWYRSIE